MTTEPVRAGAGWLQLREPVDAESRSAELADIVRTHLPTGPLVIHDLGAGTGSMARWLAPRLDGPQQWVLHDRDAELLQLAEGHPTTRSRDGATVGVEVRVGDILRLDTADLADASLITASALLDMLTADEVARLVATCAAVGCPLLVVLSVVGRVDLDPPDPLDRRLMDAFNAHQRRASSNGRLLGPDAVEAAAQALTHAGLEVLRRPSPWRLARGHEALATEWFDGWIQAALEQDPGLVKRVAPYARRRRAQLLLGTASMTIHHVDLLAYRPRGAAE